MVNCIYIQNSLVGLFHSKKIQAATANYFLLTSFTDLVHVHSFFAIKTKITWIVIFNGAQIEFQPNEL